MKLTWVVVLVAIATVIPTIALAQGSQMESIAAWCGGSYGAGGTNFGDCVRVEVKGRVAGAASGMRDAATAPTFPEYPAVSVTFERGKAMFDTGKMDGGRPIRKELQMNYMASPDRTWEVQAPGD